MQFCIHSVFAGKQSQMLALSKLVMKKEISKGEVSKLIVNRFIAEKLNKNTHLQSNLTIKVLLSRLNEIDFPIL